MKVSGDNGSISDSKSEGPGSTPGSLANRELELEQTLSDLFDVTTAIVATIAVAIAITVLVTGPAFTAATIAVFITVAVGLVATVTLAIWIADAIVAAITLIAPVIVTAAIYVCDLVAMSMRGVSHKLWRGNTKKEKSKNDEFQESLHKYLPTKLLKKQLYQGSKKMKKPSFTDGQSFQESFLLLEPQPNLLICGPEAFEAWESLLDTQTQERE